LTVPDEGYSKNTSSTLN